MTREIKKRYFTKPPDSQAKLSLFPGAHPNYFLSFAKSNVSIARNPNPKPHKTPKSIQPQKQHNTAIGLLLSRCAHEISSCRFSAGCSHGRAYEGFRAPSCRPSTTERCGLPPSLRWRNVFRILGTSLSDVRMRRAFGLE